MEYTLKRSKRARYMRLTVQPGGAVILTAPHWSSLREIERFLYVQNNWLKRNVRKMRHFKALPVAGRRDYLRYKEEARAFLAERVAHWNQQYRFPHGRIAIKNAKRLWGSCSRKGNLNFSYALLFLPRELADYVVVHELCHVKEHNHGPRFWRLVSRALPDYDGRRRALRRYVPHG